MKPPLSDVDHARSPALARLSRSVADADAGAGEPRCPAVRGRRRGWKDAQAGATHCGAFLSRFRRTFRMVAMSGRVHVAGRARVRGWRCARPVAVASPARADEYRWPIVRVVDGDALKVDAGADMPASLARLSVRIRGVDTPETHRPKCDAERRAGRAATAFVKAAVARTVAIVIRNPKWGRYGGRVVASVDIDGRSLAALLIEAGHGRPYDGGRREGWCE